MSLLGNDQNHFEVLDMLKALLENIQPQNYLIFNKASFAYFFLE